MQLKPSSSSKAIYAQFWRFPIIIKQRCQMIKYRKIITEMNHNYNVKKAYISTLEQHDIGQTTWCTYVKIY